jgi:hypothetical protein
MTTSSNVTKDWTDKDWARFSDWLEGALRQTTMKVTFTKKDGTERIMNCTLNPAYLPLVETKQKERELQKPKDYLAVYDTDLKGWRSFVIKNVKAFEFEIS